MPSTGYKVEKLKRKLKVVCNKCEKNTGQKDIDICFGCPYHILFNKMLREITDNGH